MHFYFILQHFDIFLWIPFGFSLFAIFEIFSQIDLLHEKYFLHLVRMWFSNNSGGKFHDLISNNESFSWVQSWKFWKKIISVAKQPSLVTRAKIKKKMFWYFLVANLICFQNMFSFKVLSLTQKKLWSF